MLEGCRVYLTLLNKSDILLLFSLSLEEVLLVILISFNLTIIFVFLIRLPDHQALRGRITAWIPLTGKLEHFCLTLLTAIRRR